MVNFFHKSSTVQTSLCTTYAQKAKNHGANTTEIKKLKADSLPTNNLPFTVIEVVKPMYKDLADPIE